MEASLKVQKEHVDVVKKIYREAKLMRRELTWIRMALNLNPASLDDDTEDSEEDTT